MIQSRTAKTMLLASGEFLTSSVQLISFMVLSRVLTVDDYATYRQTMLSYSFAAPFLALGLPHALFYFIPRMRDRARGILLENLLLLSIMGIVFSVFLISGGNRLLAWRFNNPSLEKTLLILAPYPLLMLPMQALGACLLSQNRVGHMAAFNVSSRVVMIIFILAASFIWRTPTAAILGVVISAAIVFSPGIAMMLSATKGSRAVTSAQGLWAQVKYSVPLGLAGMLGTLSFSIDKIIVSSICLPKDFAVYSNGAFEIPLISVVTGSITAVLLPDLAGLFSGRKKTEAVELWKRSAVKSAVILLPAMFFLFMMTPEIISVLFSSKYAASSAPFRIYLLLLPVRVVTFGAMIMAAGANHWLLWRSAGDLIINSALSLLLVSQFGYIGAAAASVITVYAWSVPMSLVVIMRAYNSGVRDILPYAALVKIFMISALASVVLIPNYFLGNYGALPRLIISGPLYFAGVFFLLLFFKLIDREHVGRLLRRLMKHR
ncbi:MAG: hypothetical protein C0402_16745 [Thermodesulfovibrio sp.]|nr:hypothetical protein [Thermodesulfovibrio sp.]